MKKLTKILATVSILSTMSLSANCVNMQTSLICDYNDETIKNIKKVKGVKYDLYDLNEKVESIEINLSNKEDVLFLNLNAYKKLRELKISKNPTSKAYIKLRTMVIKIEDNKVIKEVSNEK